MLLRQAWSSAAEYNHVFDLLFASNGDPASQRLAVCRLEAWEVRSPQSFAPALASTASLVRLLVPSSDPGRDGQQRRLALSMGITRFVNGLVDPLQQGLYARSVAQIAHELGLPSWFVELRHRATHEDLPGEAVLLQAASQALDWLYTRYWLPMLHSLSTSAPQDDDADHIALAALLQRYKTLQKAFLADSTAVPAQDLAGAVRSIEDWVDRGAMAATRGGEGSGDDEREILAVHALVQSMVEVGVLVPLSRKKRTTPLKPAPLPPALPALYGPLLSALAKAYPTTFAVSFTSHLVSVVSSAAGAGTSADEEKEEATFVATAAGWLAWCIVDSPDGFLLADEKRSAIKSLFLSSNANVANLLTYLGKVVPALMPPPKSADALLQLLADPSPGLSGLVDSASTADLSRRFEQARDRWPREPPTVPAAEARRESDKGWNLVPEADWRPCPIGMLPGGVLPDLTLVC